MSMSTLVGYGVVTLILNVRYSDSLGQPIKQELDIPHDELKMDSIDQFIARLNGILEEDLKAWIALRGDNVQKTEQTIFMAQR